MILALDNDALVLGGGPAGCTLAITLANKGRKVVLIEKNREPEHKVCGEFLSPECLHYLRQIDIDPETLGAQRIHSVRVATRDVIAEAVLPWQALSLTRKTLDEALLRQSQQAGVHVLRGYTANGLERAWKEDGSAIWKARITDSSNRSTAILGKDAFLATGKHDLRGWPRATHGTHHDLVAMKMYFALTPEQQAKMNGHIELILYRGGYAGLQPVEGGHANLSALITKEKLRSLGGRWDHVLEYMMHRSPHLASRLSGAMPILERPLAISSIPYGYNMGKHERLPISPWRLGDQAAVIPSFCGDGMAIAFYTAHRAAQFYLEGATPDVFHADIQQQFHQRLYWTAMLSRLMVTMPALAQMIRLRPSALRDLFTATRLPSSIYARGEAS